MTPLNRALAMATVMLSAVTPALGAQDPPREPRSLAAPTVLSDAMQRTPLPSVLALPNGELLVSTGGRVALLDSVLRPKRMVVEPAAATPGARGTVGRALRMFYYRGDSVLFADGTPAMSLFAPTVDSSRTLAFGRVQDLSRLMAAGVNRLDSQGRFLYTGTTTASMVAGLMGDGSAPANPGLDSVPVMAYDQRARRLDTVAYVRTGTISQMTMQREGARFIGTTVTQPFSQDDYWGVLSDGTVMIVRSVGCVIDIVTPAGLRRAPRAIPCDRRRLSPGDKDSIAALQSRSAGALNSAAAATASGTTTVRWETAPISTYPDYVPAYRGAVADHEGHLWLLRTSPLPPRGPVYDVVDRNGTLVDRVALPASTQLLGFGKKGTYVFVSSGSTGPGATAAIGLIPK